MSYELIRQKIAYFSQFSASSYLDSAATSLKPDLLWQSLKEVYAQGDEIIHRGTHALTDRATQKYEAARDAFAARFAVDRSEIIFTAGATAGLNRAACDWGLSHLMPGDEILTTVVEHHSNLVPWIEIAARTGAVVRHVDIDPASFLFDLENFIFTPRTKVLVVSAFSNVLGNVWKNFNDLKNLISKAHEAGVVVVLDGAQHAPFYNINLRDLNPDFYAFSAHKMMGPAGLGILFINRRIVGQLKPLLGGGGSVSSVSWNSIVHKKSPEVFEPGTPMAAHVVAWNAVLTWLESSINYDAERARLGGLLAQVVETILSVPGSRILGNVDEMIRSGHLVSFVIDDIHAHDLADVLSSYNVFVRAGTMCAQPLHDFLGVSASLRASLYWYSSQEDIDLFSRALKSAVTRLRGL